VFGDVFEVFGWELFVEVCVVDEVGEGDCDVVCVG